MLAERLKPYAGRSDVVVLALPRGGVPVAFEVARALRAPLDVFVVRKLGVPGHEELAMGAIARGGVRILNDDVVSYLNIPPESIDRVAERERLELERREKLYRGERKAVEAGGKTAILIDDGLATGSTMRAAVAALRQEGPSGLVVAVPVAPSNTCQDLASEVDEVVCLMKPSFFQSVGQWYEDFFQTTDEQVCALLEEASRLVSDHTPAPGEPQP